MTAWISSFQRYQNCCKQIARNTKILDIKIDVSNHGYFQISLIFDTFPRNFKINLRESIEKTFGDALYRSAVW